MDPHKDAQTGNGHCATSELVHGPDSTTEEEKPSTSQDAPPLEDPSSGQHLLGRSFSSLKRSLSSLRHRSPTSHCNDPTSKPGLSARALFHASTWPRSVLLPTQLSRCLRNCRWAVLCPRSSILYSRPWEFSLKRYKGENAVVV